MSGRMIVLAALTAALLTGCGDRGTTPAGTAPSGGTPSGGIPNATTTSTPAMPTTTSLPAPGTDTIFRVTSPAFADGAEIPEQFTCAGAGEAPPLQWTASARATMQALVVDDPDAPGGTFVHWVVFDLPGSTTGLPQGGALSPNAKQGGNSVNGVGWTPPCPPSGTHHYRFTVYALTGPTGLASGAPPQDAIPTIERLSTGRGQLVGLVTHR